MKPSDQARWQGLVDSWLAQNNARGSANGAADETIICDSGQLVAGWYDFTIHCHGKAAHDYGYIEHRNAANSADVYHWYCAWPKIYSNVYNIHNWKVESNERMRVKVRGVSTDTIRVDIQWVKRA